MRSIIITTAAVLYYFTVNAQTGTLPVEKIQKLLNKTEGLKYVNTMGNDEKITRQEITETTYSFYYTGLGKYGSKWVQEFTNIPWGKGFKQFTMEGHGNARLTVCVFRFESDLDFYMHVQGETGNGKSKGKSLEFYILTRDRAEFEALIKK